MILNTDFTTLLILDADLHKAGTQNNSKTETNLSLVKPRKKVKRLCKQKLEKLFHKKVKKHLEAESEIRKLQKTCIDLQNEVKQWKESTEKLTEGFERLSKQVMKSSESRSFVKSKNIKPEKILVQEESLKTKVVIEDNLPSFPARVTFNNSLPTPSLKLTQTQCGLEVFWTFPGDHTSVGSYELFAFRSAVARPPSAAWMKVGDVKSIPLPIRCTLSSFKSGSTYTFIVRSKDPQGRVGNFSDSKTISLV